MNCPLCGENNLPDATVCRRCGRTLSNEQTKEGLSGHAVPSARPLRRVSWKKAAQNSAKLPVAPPVPRITPTTSVQQIRYDQEASPSKQQPLPDQTIDLPERSSNKGQPLMPPTTKKPAWGEPTPAKERSLIPPAIRTSTVMPASFNGSATPPPRTAAPGLASLENIPDTPPAALDMALLADKTTQPSLAAQMRPASTVEADVASPFSGSPSNVSPIANAHSLPTISASSNLVQMSPALEQKASGPLPQDSSKYLIAVANQFRELFEDQDNPSPSEVLRAYVPRRPHKWLIATSIALVLVLLGGTGVWYYLSQRPNDAVPATSQSIPDAAACVTGGAGHDLACWSANIDITITGAISGHATAEAFCTLFRDVDNNGQQNQHIDCGTVNPFSLGDKQYRLSWFVYHYINPGNYGSSDVTAILPQMQSQPLLLWNGNVPSGGTNATINTDKMSGVLNIKLIQNIPNQAGAQAATPSSPSIVAITGIWKVMDHTCRNSHELHFCP